MHKHTITMMNYSAPADYSLDIEIITFDELLKRASKNRLASLHRVTFNHLLVVTEGNCTHTVDFKPITCIPGHWLLIQAGQVQRFDVATDWQGWLVLYRLEFLSAQTEIKGARADDLFQSLPTLLHLADDEHQAGVTTIAQMASDARKYGYRPDGHRLIQAGLYWLLKRLQFVANEVINPEQKSTKSAHRFQQFKKLVEAELHLNHHSYQYAKQLGCSEKSLNRSVRDISGLSAKQYLMQRISIQAKRLLVHTSLPIATISTDLGFDEPTNFVKFFKREVGISPLAFRQQYIPQFKK